MRNKIKIPTFAKATAGNGGFIKTIILVLAALVLLKYIYKIDVIDFLTTGKFKEYLDRGYQIFSDVSTRYMETASKVWHFCSEFIKKIF